MHLIGVLGEQQVHLDAAGVMAQHAGGEVEPGVRVLLALQTLDEGVCWAFDDLEPVAADCGSCRGVEPA